VSIKVGLKNLGYSMASCIIIRLFVYTYKLPACDGPTTLPSIGLPKSRSISYEPRENRRNK